MSESQSDRKSRNEHLAQIFYANGRYNPHFLGLMALGFFSIYLLTRADILGLPSPQLLSISAITLLLAAVQFPLLILARRNRGIAAHLLGSLAICIFAVLLTNLWQGISWVSIVIILIMPVAAVQAGLPRRYTWMLALLVLTTMAGILYFDRNTTFNRLQTSSPAAIASIVFLVATTLLLLTIRVIAENKNFKSLRTLLLTSFIVIVTIPTTMAALLSAVGAFTNGQAQTFSTLKAISSLKENQISTLIRDFQNDTEHIQSDPSFTLTTLSILKETGKVADLDESKRQVRAHIENAIGSEEEQYREVMVLNDKGEVVISTLPENEGQQFQDQLFFSQGRLKFYTGFSNIASFGDENLVIATPISDEQGKSIRGVLVLRSRGSLIKQIMESTPGFENAETYLVDRNFNPVTKTRIPVNEVMTQASQEAVQNQFGNGQAIYDNYEKQPVLGYYQWFDPMQLAFISEVPLRFVVANSVKSLAASAVLALFAIAMAVASVAISARSIVKPITALAQTSESFAAGKLSARAPVDRADEIGALARSYNQMAAQLQEIIGRLEQRVNDRTRDLENQTFRLRVAAEIARDAASARDLGDLLDRSAELIQNRFNFYHTAIFLLDGQEYGILAASPTEAGKQMMANNLKIRVGEPGTVSRVAATGEARVASDTGMDAVHFNNPYLPNTRSELALPLKSENKVIGVLDIHSEQPKAFDDEDVALMQGMADQLATAIERTRLLQELERSLKELESTYGQYTRDNWKRMTETTLTGNKGYRFDNVRMETVTELPMLAKSAMDKGTTLSSNGQGTEKQTTVAIPVKLRGQSIGVITLKLNETHAEDTISTVELATERLASALESARLYEEARLRADREQSISHVATAISASTEYEEILQTTIREIGANLKDTEVSIQIVADLNTGKANGA